MKTTALGSQATSINAILKAPSYRTQSGEVSLKGQALILALVAADKSADPQEIAAVQKAITSGDSFEGGSQFAKRWSQMLGKGEKAVKKGFAAPKNAISIQTGTKPSFDNGVCVLAGEHCTSPGPDVLHVDVPQAVSEMAEGQTLIVPLKPGLPLYGTKIEYQDVRSGKELLIEGMENGKSVTFPAGEYQSWVSREKSSGGKVAVKRSFNGEPYEHNPLIVHYRYVGADGKTLRGRKGAAEGTKFVDWEVASGGMREIDNINHTYDRLPQGPIPEGAYLELSLERRNRQPHETTEKPLRVRWVRNQSELPASAKVKIYEAQSEPWQAAWDAKTKGDGKFPKIWQNAKAQGYRPIKSDGYPVEAGRKVAYVQVTISDFGHWDRIRLRYTDAQGKEHLSKSENVGAGETKTFAMDHVVKDGKIFFQGGSVTFIKDVTVGYA